MTERETAPAPVTKRVQESEPASAPEAADTPEATEKARRGFFGRLNPFSKSKTSDDEIAAAIEEAARTEAESSSATAGADIPADAPPEAAAETAAEDAPRKRFLGIFGGGGGDKTASKTEGLDKTKEATPKKVAEKPVPPVAPPTTAPPADAEAEAAKKPSNLNPLNWFRSGKKDKEAPKDSPPEEPAAPAKAKKETLDKKSVSAPAVPEADPIASQIMAGGPILAMVFQEVAVAEAGTKDKNKAAANAQETGAEEKPAAEKKRFLGIFGKKKPAEEEPAPESPKESAKPKDAPKETVKPKDAPKETAKPQEAPPPAEKPEPEATPPPPGEKPKRQPLKLHLFGSDKKEPEAKEADEIKKNEEQAAAPSTLEPAAEAPAKPKVAAAAKDKSRPSENETPVAASIPIEDYAAIIKRKDLAKIMERNANALAVLQNRGSILFRPIIKDYVSALEDILKGKTKGMDARLRTLRTRTQAALDQSNAVRDLLDLHEANDSAAMSGLFEDYLKLPMTIQNELPERTDPISKYLDALDKEFSKE